MKRDHLEKRVFWTLDLEPDHCDLVEGYHYEGFGCIDYLVGLLREGRLALTVFATGRAIEDRPQMVQRLAEAGAEVELHAYRHKPPSGGITEIIEGIRAYRGLFGRSPRGYRAPLGMISREEIEYLADEGFLFDSSLFPSFFPGRFSHFRSSSAPFIHAGTTLWELPISVIPVVRLPLSLSYIQLASYPVFRFLSTIFGLPAHLVLDFHLHDIFPSRVFHELPLAWKLIYSRCFMRRRANGIHYLDTVRAWLQRRGYVCAPLSSLYDLCEKTRADRR